MRSVAIVFGILLMSTAAFSAQKGKLCETHCFKNLEGQMHLLADTDSDPQFAKLELSFVSANGNIEKSQSPSPHKDPQGKLTVWIKKTYRSWASKDHSGSTRLLLLSIGLVGIIGIRRKLKKP